MSRPGRQVRQTRGGAASRRRPRGDDAMRYMLLMSFGAGSGVPPVSDWAPEDVRASGAHMMAIHEELTANGELVGAEGLTGPEAAKIVTHDGIGAPVVTDGPFAESK